MPRTKELERQLEETQQQLQLFQKISRMTARDLNLRNVLQGIVSLVEKYMQCDACLLYLVEGQELVLCAANSERASAIGNIRLALDEGLTGWVARERRLLAISREAYRDPRFKKFQDLPEDSFEAFLSAPIVARNRVVGVINVQHRAAHSHTGAEMELLSTVGEQVGCQLLVARLDPSMTESADHVEFVLSAGAASAPNS